MFLGIPVVFQGDPGPAFAKVGFDSGQTCGAFLADLAQQRNFVISNTILGETLFWQPTAADQPDGIFVQGAPPLHTVTPNFDAQSYFSHITGRRPAKVGVRGARHTVENPHLKGVIRPHIFTVDDAPSADIKAAVNAKMGRMFANAISYDIDLPTWRDVNKRLWRVGSTMDVTAPDVMIYNKYRFIARTVTLTKARESGAESAGANLIFPGAFAGQIPDGLPWD